MEYIIYVSDNDSAYTEWLIYSRSNANYFKGEVGHTYKFFSQARDRAANVEDLHTSPDAQTKILIGVEELLKPFASSLKVVPNPFTEKASVQFYLNANNEVTLSLTDLLGRDVQLLYKGSLNKGQQAFDIATDKLPGGIYSVRLSTPNDVLNERVVLIRK
jgi:hypothetical protein